MKAARRQELRTNDLSQKLDQLGESAKQNSTMLTAVVVGAAVVVSAVYWFSSHKIAVRDEALSKLNYDAVSDDPMSFIERCKSVAAEGVSEDVTRTAWLQAANRAVYEMTTPSTEKDANAKPLDTAELSKIAREAFTQVLRLSTNDATARGAALFGLGVLDENDGKFDAARKQYEEVRADKAFGDTPFAKQAEFRLAQLNTWAQPVKFPAPPPLVIKPEDTAATPTFVPTPEKKTITIGNPPPGIEITPEGKAVLSPTAAPNAPAPTTQPAQN